MATKQTNTDNIQATRPLTEETLFVLRFMSDRNLGVIRDDVNGKWLFPEDFRQDETLAPRIIEQCYELRSRFTVNVEVAA